MKAARFYGQHDLRVEDVPEPSDRLGPREVLVRNDLCGICGTDLHEYAAGPIFVPKGAHPFSGASMPMILGHEFGGKVIAVGSAIEHVAVGDRVSIMPHVAPSEDFYGRRGLRQLSDSLAVIGLSWPWGGMGEYAVVNDYNAVPISDDLTDEQSALIEPVAVVVHAAERAGIRPGASVLVTGAGPIGQLQVMAARAAGASRIFLSDTNDNRLELARKISQDVITLNPKRDNVGDAVRDQTEAGIGADAVIECSGTEAALAAGIDAVRKQGVVVQLGMHVGKASVDAFMVTCKEIDVRGSFCYSTLMWPRVASLMAAGMLPAEKIVTSRIKLADVVAGGFEPLLDPAGTELKILVDLH